MSKSPITLLIKSFRAMIDRSQKQKPPILTELASSVTNTDQISSIDNQPDRGALFIEEKLENIEHHLMQLVGTSYLRTMSARFKAPTKQSQSKSAIPKSGPDRPLGRMYFNLHSSTKRL